MQHLDGMTIGVSLPIVRAGSMCGASPALSPAPIGSRKAAAAASRMDWLVSRAARSYPASVGLSEARPIRLAAPAWALVLPGKL